MKKTILFAFAFSISSFVFSQTNNNQKIEKAPRENNSGYCASCPKSKTNLNDLKTTNQQQQQSSNKVSRKIEGTVTELTKAKQETKK